MGDGEVMWCAEWKRDVYEGWTGAMYMKASSTQAYFSCSSILYQYTLVVYFSCILFYTSIKNNKNSV